MIPDGKKSSAKSITPAMTEIDRLLCITGHRPFELPAGRWAYYQEWNKVLFLHWKVPSGALRQLVPGRLNIDTFEGDAYISLVAFTMERTRPGKLPAFKFISDFDEINIRTYVDHGNRKGVYFLNIEAGKRISAFIARIFSGLPYERSDIQRTAGRYRSVNTQKQFCLDTEFEIKEPLTGKTGLDHWLTERYCLYLDKGEKIYRYDIHHQEWTIKDVEIKRLDLEYKMGEISLTGLPDVAHYSDGVKVVAWPKRDAGS